MFEITDQEIETYICKKKITNRKTGAEVIFKGLIRDINDSKNVTSLEFEVYDELAIKEGTKILIEAIKKFNLLNAYCVHRTGHLNITDTAVYIITTSIHREEAFLGTKYIIDELKKRVPIWKKEYYQTGEATWQKGHIPQV